jgi:hypothetical protein
LPNRKKYRSQLCHGSRIFSCVRLYWARYQRQFRGSGWLPFNFTDTFSKLPIPSSNPYTDTNYYSFTASGTNTTNLEFTLAASTVGKQAKLNALKIFQGNTNNPFWKSIGLRHGYITSQIEETGKSILNLSGSTSAIFYELPKSDLNLNKTNFFFIPKSNAENLNTFTILTHFKLNNFGIGNTRLTEKARDYQNRNWTLEITQTGDILFVADGEKNGQNSLLLTTKSTKVILNKEHSVAASYDGNWLKIFLDGELIGSKNVVDVPKKNQHEITFGKAFDYGPKYFDGTIYSVLIFDRQLSNQEIKDFSL